MKIEDFKDLSLEEKKELLMLLKSDIKFCGFASIFAGISSLGVEVFTVYEGYLNYLDSGNPLTGDFNIKYDGFVLAFCILSYLSAGLESEKLYKKTLLLEKDINES